MKAKGKVLGEEQGVVRMGCERDGRGGEERVGELLVSLEQDTHVSVWTLNIAQLLGYHPVP